GRRIASFWIDLRAIDRHWAVRSMDQTVLFGVDANRSSFPCTCRLEML
ncbi:hypothetical protein WJX84_004518, partial [Apatococcus fuscideae]